MNVATMRWLAGAAAAMMFNAALADDLEGRIKAIDREGQAIVVQGITFVVTDRTDFDDGLTGFADLREGQRVEIDFEYRDGRHYALEIELED